MAQLNQHRSRALWAGLSAMLVLVLLDVSVAVLGLRLDEPLQWYSAQAQTKAEQLDQLAGGGRSTDVAFIGSSIVDLDIDVATFEELTGLSAWNGGLPAAQATVMERWALEEVGPALEPDLIVVGLSSLELNDNRPRPTIDLYDRQPHSRTGWLAGLDRRAAGFSGLIRHRRQLRRPATLVENLAGNDRSSLDGSEFELLLAAEPDRIRDDVLNDYTLGGRELKAFSRLVTGLSADGARVVVVWMPVPDKFVALHPNGESDFEAARDAVITVVDDVSSANSEPVTWLDLSDAQPDDAFRDFTHLGDAEASRFTEQLVAALDAEGLLRSD